MTTETLAPAVIAPGAVHRGPGPVRAAVEDTATVTWRNLKKMSRMPQLLVFATVQPIIFVLMFRYVFGGAIKVPGVRYVDYLMPGIFAQTVVFGSLQTGVGLAEDLRTGLIERFRALPMARMAVLAGRTIADLVRNVFVVLLMLIVGYLVGWRLHTNVIALVGGIGVMLAFSFALTWLFAIVGLATGDPETAQAASFPLLAPLVFASTAFVPLHSMPGWLQVFANNQPVSVTVDAVRDLTLGGPTTHDVSLALVWSIALIATFAPLAVARYRRAA